MAVKVLHAEESKQKDEFRQEVAMLEGLRHTHIVNYLGHVFEETGEVRAPLILGVYQHTHECDMCAYHFYTAAEVRAFAIQDTRDSARYT